MKEHSREFLNYSREIYNFQCSQVNITLCFAVSYKIIFYVYFIKFKNIASPNSTKLVKENDLFAKGRLEWSTGTSLTF